MGLPDRGSGLVIGWRWAPLLAGILALLLWAAWARWPGPVVAVDIDQPRADVALPVPRGAQENRQSFTPAWDGLSEIELLLLRQDGAEPGQEQFTLSLKDSAGRVVAGQSWPAASLSHNQALLFRFAPQAHSAGRLYTLVMAGSQNNPVTAWGYSLDVYGGGWLSTAGQSAARELRFVTRYQLAAGTALRHLGATAWQEGGPLLLALLFLLLPGWVLLPAFSTASGWDAPTRWAVALACGAALWPLLWFWLTLAGGRWRPWSLWLALGLCLGLAGRRWLAARRARGRRAGRAWLAHLPLLLLLGLSLAVRLLAVRQQAFPLWVDASRHALISQIMAGSGQVPGGYRPYLPVDQFPYHFGFHTLSASLAMLLGWPLPALLLYLGQLLNGLAPLTVYGGLWLLGRRRGPALLAAFLVGLPFFFPAYYATWGRFTQLTALLLLPLLLAFTWQWLHGGPAWRPVWPLVGLLAAGIFLIHLRVFLLYLPFAAIALLAAGRDGLRRLWPAAVLGGGLVLPRLWQLLRLARGVDLTAPIANYNQFPTGYFSGNWERFFLGLAGAGLALLLGAGWKRRQWPRLPLVLAVWVGVVALALSGRVPGLPQSWLLNVNSATISLYVPLAFLLALLGERGWDWLRCRHWPGQLLPLFALGAGLAAATLFGLRQQVTILNPQTVLAYPQDLAGVEWVEANLPPEARIANGAWKWLGDTWAASDGGGWLLPLTGRAVSTPPVDYTSDRELRRQVNQFNEAAAGIKDWSTVEAATWLRAQGISAVFVGQKGSFFDPAQLARNPGLAMVYHQDGVFIFRLRPGE